MDQPPFLAAARARRGRASGYLLVGVLLLAASGCGLEEARDGAASPILGDGVSDEIDALEVVDPLIHEKLDDCVDYGQLQAFAGDPEWQRVWQDSGQTVAGYRRYCERLANNEPDKFRAIHLEWEAFKTSTS
jgi:hypothetical protein